MIKWTKLRLRSWEETAQHTDSTAQKAMFTKSGGRRWRQLRSLCLLLSISLQRTPWACGSGIRDGPAAKAWASSSTQTQMHLKFQMSPRLGWALRGQDMEVMWSCLSPRQARQSPSQLVGMKKLSNRSFSHAIGKMREGKRVMVLHHSPPYPRTRRSWQFARTFHSIFFMLYMQKRRRNPALRFWLPLSYLLHSDYWKACLKNISIGTYYFVLQRTSSCLPAPCSTRSLTRTHFWHFSVPVVVFISDTRVQPASCSTRFLKQCRDRLTFLNAFHLHSS